MSLTDAKKAFVAAFLDDKRLWVIGEPTVLEAMIERAATSADTTTTINGARVSDELRMKVSGAVVDGLLLRVRLPPSVVLTLPHELELKSAAERAALQVLPVEQPQAPPPPVTKAAPPPPKSRRPTAETVRGVAALAVVVGCVVTVAVLFAPRFTGVQLDLPVDGVPCVKTVIREGILYCTVKQDAMPIDIRWGDARKRIVITKKFLESKGYNKVYFLEQHDDGRWMSPLWDREPKDPERRGDQ